MRPNRETRRLGTSTRAAPAGAAVRDAPFAAPLALLPTGRSRREPYLGHCLGESKRGELQVSRPVSRLVGRLVSCPGEGSDARAERAIDENARTSAHRRT